MASSSRHPASWDAPPTALEHLHIVDVLALATSQAEAGAALAMHHSAMCPLRQQLHLAETVQDPHENQL